MTFAAYLAVGGLEVVNSARVRAYAETSECPVFWLKGDSCPTLEHAYNDGVSYREEGISAAPWYDPTASELSSRFFGVHGVTLEGINDSPLASTIVESIGPGGVVSRPRMASKPIRVRAILLGRGEDALTYGLNWLNSVLEPTACGRHGDACGATDTEHLVDCPPAPFEGEGQESYQRRVDVNRRWLHNVGVITAAFVVEEMAAAGANAYLVEFVLGAGNPYVYGTPRRVDLPLTPSTIVEDVAYNLVPYPSAEVAGPEVQVAINHSTNPSLETSVSQWAAIWPSTFPAAMREAGRSNERARVGTWGYRMRFLGASATEEFSDRPGVMTISHTVPNLSGLAGSRMSFTVWAAALVAAGAAGTTVETIGAMVQFISSTGSVIRADEMGVINDPADMAGYTFRLKNLETPAGTVQARIRVDATVAVSSSADAALNSDLRLYADAAAATRP